MNKLVAGRKVLQCKITAIHSEAVYLVQECINNIPL
jgi:hypothetical protein